MENKKNKTADEFLIEKLISEISVFGDGITEFHTRDLSHLVNSFQEQKLEIENLKNEIKRLNEILNGVENLCDNSDSSHENIWRLVHTTLENSNK